MHDFSDLNFYEFEHYIRQLLEKVGYDFIDCIRRDELAGEVDLACLTRKHFFMGQTFFWCRKYPQSKVVDADTVEALCEEMKKDKYKDCVPVKGVIITTSTFTRPAYDNYEYKNPIEYVNGNELKGLFDQYGVEVKPFGSDMAGFGIPSKFGEDKDVMNILVVHDAPEVHQSFSMMFENTPQKVNFAFAYDGLQALAFIERYNFDLVITRVNLMNIRGLQVIEYIKKKYPKTEVIVFESFASEENQKRAIELGAFDYIRIPFTMDEIFMLVNRVKGKRR